MLYEKPVPAKFMCSHKLLTHELSYPADCLDASTLEGSPSLAVAAEGPHPSPKTQNQRPKNISEVVQIFPFVVSSHFWRFPRFPETWLFPWTLGKYYFLGESHLDMNSGLKSTPPPFRRDCYGVSSCHIRTFKLLEAPMNLPLYKMQ